MTKFLDALRHIIKRALHRPLYALYKHYTLKERDLKYDGLTIRLFPGVFHPRFFGSTLIFLNWLRNRNLKGKEIMELGAGSGLISLALAREGARVTATDISRTVVKALQENSKRNDIDLKIIHSDLFDEVPDQVFDYVIINPPYFPREPASEADHAFYCGVDFSYFKRLFSQLKTRGAPELVWMVLSADCDLEKIQAIARQKALSLSSLHKERHLFEWFYIFEVQNLSTLH